MSLQMQHFPLRNLKTQSVGPAGVRARDLPLSRPALSQLSQPGGGYQLHDYRLPWYNYHGAVFQTLRGP